MTVIEGLRSYFASCPLLEDGILQVDFLAPEDASYSLDVESSTPIIKRYMDGSSKRQQAFTLRTRCAYGADILTQIENIGFFEQLQAWIEKKMFLRQMPSIGTDKKAISIEASSSGYAVSENENYAQYIINLNLIFTQEGCKNDSL